jgi:hypothetical protein
MRDFDDGNSGQIYFYGEPQQPKPQSGARDIDLYTMAKTSKVYSFVRKHP